MHFAHQATAIVLHRARPGKDSLRAQPPGRLLRCAAGGGCGQFSRPYGRTRTASLKEENKLSDDSVTDDGSHTSDKQGSHLLIHTLSVRSIHTQEVGAVGVAVSMPMRYSTFLVVLAAILVAHNTVEGDDNGPEPIPQSKDSPAGMSSHK